MSLVVICCHSLSFIVTRCHWFSLVFIRRHSLSLVVPLLVTWCITRLSFYKQSIKHATKDRPVETGGGLGRATALPSPRFLLNSAFHKLKKIELKWKIVQNYKTSWNSSKFIDIYKIIGLDTRDGILSVIHDERFPHS